MLMFENVGEREKRERRKHRAYEHPFLKVAAPVLPNSIARWRPHIAT